MNHINSLPPSGEALDLSKRPEILREDERANNHLREVRARQMTSRSFKKFQVGRSELPVSDYRDEILEAIEQNQVGVTFRTFIFDVWLA